MCWTGGIPDMRRSQPSRLSEKLNWSFEDQGGLNFRCLEKGLMLALRAAFLYLSTFTSLDRSSFIAEAIAILQFSHAHCFESPHCAYCM